MNMSKAFKVAPMCGQEKQIFASKQMFAKTQYSVNKCVELKNWN